MAQCDLRGSFSSSVEISVRVVTQSDPRNILLEILVGIVTQCISSWDAVRPERLFFKQIGRNCDAVRFERQFPEVWG